MAVNKVVYGTTVLVDLTTDTVTADTLKEGVTAHNSAGELITGTNSNEDVTEEVEEYTLLNTELEEVINSLPNVSDLEPVLQDKSVTPTTNTQTVTADDDYDGLGTVTVNPIPEDYVKPTTTKGATTYTPNTSDQTIASGTYLSGTQTIKGDINLVADNIKSGVSIFGVNGTYEGSGGSGGGSAGTCNVTINANGVAVIGWGEGTWSYSGITQPCSLPSTEASPHNLPFAATYNFPSMPIGSTFVFYRSNNIKGATVSDNIEFSFVEVDTTTDTKNYKFAICKCNGDGEITINV